LADRHTITTKGVGMININIKVRQEIREGSLKDVLYILSLVGNLFSVNKTVDMGNLVVFDKSGCVVKDHMGKIIAVTPKERNLYQISIINSFNKASMASKTDDIEIWHHQIGHLSVRGMCQLEKGMVKGLQFDKNQELPLCCSCIEGKQHLSPLPSSGGMQVTKMLEIIHMDVCGPMKSPSIGGVRYFLMFTDDKTHKTFVYFIKVKDETFTKFKEFWVLVENQMGEHIKIL
jgi:GAG-pre-integrase domain